jgi:hypothetical protein
MRDYRTIDMVIALGWLIVMIASAVGLATLVIGGLF